MIWDNFRKVQMTAVLKMLVILQSITNKAQLVPFCELQHLRCTCSQPHPEFFDLIFLFPGLDDNMSNVHSLRASCLL